MRDDYTRLVKAGQPFDHIDTAENYQGYNTVNNIDIPDNDENFDLERKEVVNLSDVDNLKLSKVLQDVFFDLYGTNLPNEKENEVIESLPKQIPNNIEMFELMLTKVLRKLKVYEWVDNNSEDEITAPQQLQQEVEEIVDTGDSGDIDEEEIDEMLDPDQLSLTPQQSAKIASQINNEVRHIQAQKIKQEQLANRNQSQKRDLAQAKQTRPTIAGERMETIYLKNMKQDPTLQGWDIGVGNNGVRSASSSAGTGSGSGGDGWYGLVRSGNLDGGGAFGLPTIDCDKFGGV